MKCAAIGILLALVYIHLVVINMERGYIYNRNVLLQRTPLDVARSIPSQLLILECSQ